MIDCQLCPRVLPSGARCPACKRLMCDVCVQEAKVPPDDPDDVDGYELLVYRPAYTGGDFFCGECRNAYAFRCVERYRQQSFPDYDPIAWAAAVAAAGIAFDLPRIDDSYNLARGWADFARHQGLPMVSATRYLAAPPGTPPPTDTVSGWLVEAGCIFSSSFSDPEYGIQWSEESCDVVVCSGGNWYALGRPLAAIPGPLAKYATRWNDAFHGRKRRSIDDSFGDSDFRLRPKIFLQAAMDFARA